MNVTNEIKLFSASYNIKRLLNLLPFENLKDMIESYINPDNPENKYYNFLNLKNIVKCIDISIISDYKRSKIVFQY